MTEKDLIKKISWALHSLCMDDMTGAEINIGNYLVKAGYAEWHNQEWEDLNGNVTETSVMFKVK